jgi:hypothetical protein
MIFERILRLKGRMIDGANFELIEDDVIDFGFIDNFLIGVDFVIQPLIRIQFQAEGVDSNIIRFVPNEEIIGLNQEEARRDSRQD